MQETWKNLEALQELDLQIGQILKKRSEFPAKLNAFDTEIKKLMLQIEEKNKGLVEFERNNRQQMGAIELNEERTKRSQEKMTQIKNSNELSAVQREIESLAKNSEIIKENAKKSEIEIKRIKDEVATIQNSINEITAKKEQEENKIRVEDKDLSSGLGTLESQRQATATLVEKRVMAVYDKVRVARSGVGVALATDGLCQGCNIKLPPQIYNELQKNQTEVRQCPSCKRIMIFKAKS